MLKPVGAACNLRCEYCYYLEKSNLYRDAQKRVLSEEMLEQFTKASGDEFASDRAILS